MGYLHISFVISLKEIDDHLDPENGTMFFVSTGMALFLSILELGSCQTGWKEFGQFCYQFNLNKKSWHDARLSCVNQQAELVSIHSPVEQAHITLEVGPDALDAEAWIGKQF